MTEGSAEPLAEPPAEKMPKIGRISVHYRQKKLAKLLYFELVKTKSAFHILFAYFVLSRIWNLQNTAPNSNFARIMANFT